MNSYKIETLFEAENYKVASKLQNAICELVNSMEETGTLKGCFEILLPVELDTTDDKGKQC